MGVAPNRSRINEHATQAIAPLWEVKTARLQQDAGDPNAGLTEEERAAKAGLAAPLDAAYAATHASDPEAKNKRQGHFMAVGLDLNGDGRIDASDPVYQQLQVWQDLNQDGNNTHSLTVGRHSEMAQDETEGVKELRSLAEWGINAIDHANNSYDFDSDLRNGGVGYWSISYRRQWGGRQAGTGLSKIRNSSMAPKNQPILNQH